MSRSYKKHPIVKDKGRRDYNKLFRNKTKQAIREGQDPPTKTREVVNDYDVCDWVSDFRRLSKTNKNKILLRKFMGK